MIAKKLFFTIVALGILFLPFSVVAADKNTMWQQLIEQEGCLLSSTDINYTISGSVFEKKLWKNFLNYAQNNKAVFYSIVNKFGSRKATKLHICNFRNATEGEVAVFVAQRIAEKNWYSYDGNNDKLKAIAQKKVAAKVQLLKNVIEDKEMCKELQFFFKQQYNLKNEIKEVVAELKSLQQDGLENIAKDFSSFVQNIQNISPEMSPEEIEKLLGKATKKSSHGQFKFHNPDLFTFYRYELLTTSSPNLFYRVTIMFSKNKGRIISVYSDTNHPKFASKKKDD